VMDVILIPGFWLDVTSWDEVVPALEQVGHHAHPLTLPGMEAKDADRWPQVTRPQELGPAILASVGPA
jgi:hypothetical protein